MRHWVEMFAKDLLTRVAADPREEFLKKVEKELRPALYRDGTWRADYRWLPVVASQLVYHGKEREEEILANTLAVPLQPVRTFGGNGGHGNDEWRNMLIFGDNLQAMKSLLEMKNAGKLCNADGTPGVRLIYIDPPFASRKEFQGNQEQKAYQDKVAGAQFIEFLRKRLILLKALLASNGCIYVHMDQRKSHYAKVILDELFGEHNFVNEIAWKSLSAHNDAHK